MDFLRRREASMRPVTREGKNGYVRIREVKAAGGTAALEVS